VNHIAVGSKKSTLFEQEDHVSKSGPALEKKMLNPSTGRQEKVHPTEPPVLWGVWKGKRLSASVEMVFYFGGAVLKKNII